MFTRFRTFAVWILLLALLGAVHAQVAPQPQPKPRRFLMWKATSPTTTVYLVGSIHVGDNSMYPLPQELETAFSASRVLAVEINMKNGDPSKTMELVQKYGMYGAGDSLSKHLTREQSAALDEFCNKHGLQRATIEQVKPWVVSMSIAGYSWTEAGEDPNLGVDMHFLNESKQPQRIDELESIDSQLSLFANATDEEQLGLLDATLKRGDKIRDLMKRLQAAYLSGDPAALQKLLDEQTDMGSKSLMKKFLDDRNVTMAARVDQYLKGKEQAFVVVGAAHIIGEKGVAQLLRDKGYKVEQVALEGK